MIALAVALAVALGWKVGRAVAGRPAWMELVAAGTAGALSLVAAGAAALATLGGPPRDLEELFILGMAATVGGEAAVLALALGSGRGVSWTPIRREHVVHGLIGLAVVLATWAAWNALIPIQEQPLIGLLRNPPRPWLPLAIVVGAVAVAPVVEEAIFRGWSQPLLAEIVGGRWALILVACGFTLLHADTPTALPPILAIGLTTGWLRDRHGSIIPGLILHVLNNGVSVGLALSG